MKSVSSRLLRARALLGTFVEITAAGANDRVLERGIEAAFKAVERVQDRMSFHDSESDVSRLNRAKPGELVTVDNWTFQVLQASRELQRRSRGCFNAAVAGVLLRLGLLPASTPSEQNQRELESMTALELLPGNAVRMQEERIIDLGGIAKGFAVDRAVGVLRELGVPSGLVNAGGDLAAFGPDAYTVAIRDPLHPARVMCNVAIKDAALASSGLTFDAVERPEVAPSAIIDPGRCEPTRAISGATVRASSCMIADALTKVVMISGAHSSAVLDHYGASALFITANGEAKVTANWQDAFSVAA